MPSIDLLIDNVAFGGPGVARVEGIVVFVKGALPGDRGRARIIRKMTSAMTTKSMTLLMKLP